MKRNALSCVIIYVGIANLEKVMKCLFLVGLLLLCGSGLLSEEIPNGDGDLIWEQDISPRFVRDAKFHPITGNIIAAVNHEIWEIDVKDGHKIRVFEGGPATGPDNQFHCVQITSDGKFVITGRGSGIEGLIIRDYETGKIVKTFINGEKFDGYGNLGIFPDNNRIVFFTYLNDSFFFNIYDISLNKIVNRIKSNKWPDEFALSKDGKYIAMGTRYESNGKILKNMELWDAENLTHIRVFGEAFSANEFWDVKISYDNQYVGFMANSKLYLYKLNGDKVDLLDINTRAANICFTNDNSSILFGRVKNEEYYIDIINLQQNKITYSFLGIKPGMNTVFNKNNEIFAGQSGIKLFSNRWFTVDVEEEKPDIFKINYLNNKLTIENSIGLIMNKINITDITGKIIYSKEIELNSIDIVKLDILLKNGVYFATIQTENGKLYSQKFMVVE